MTEERNRRKSRTGVVVSDKREKTVTVAIKQSFPHPKYGKIVRKTKKLYAHDDSFDAKVGDTVRVMETKPISKMKRWRITEVIERAK
ncbi:MAG: 30S ribosomal protein S17 [Actinobacteria bacterium]|nr:30S ribosomal protein S17 [Actinomycetota bacterium]|tara:strand:+ start:620 stop:880 length:261 start_codon:yes stop_codon:yes gene_type:complete